MKVMTKRIGDQVIITDEPMKPCKLCGKMKECRPYGPQGEEVCFDCAKKDPAAMRRGVRKMMLGEGHA